VPNQLTIEGKGGHFRCFWLDNSGGKPWSDIASYNFNAMPNAQSGWQNTTSGSYALSDTLQVNAGQQLNVAVILASAHVQAIFDFGFALLVQGTTVQKVLFAMRPDGSTVIGDMGPIVNLAPPSPGVTVDLRTPNSLGAVGIVLDGVNYGPAGAGSGDLSVYLSSQCSPSPGEYQILFGMFVTASAANQARPAAMILPFFNVT
jgi:hypothetical protein